MDGRDREGGRERWRQRGGKKGRKRDKRRVETPRKDGGRSVISVFVEIRNSEHFLLNILFKVQSKISVHTYCVLRQSRKNSNKCG